MELIISEYVDDSNPTTQKFKADLTSILVFTMRHTLAMVDISKFNVMLLLLA